MPVEVHSDPYRPLLLRLARTIGALMLRLLFRVSVEGLDNIPASGSVILASNHVGSMDGPMIVLLASRPVRALVKLDFFVGLRGTLLKAIGQVPIRRGAPDRVALRRALQVLADDGALAIFPEGECGPGTLDEVELGVAWLALRSHAPVLPVACFGTDSAIANHDWRPRLRAPVRIVFGSPFALADFAAPRSRQALTAAAEDIRLRLVHHLDAASPSRRS